MSRKALCALGTVTLLGAMAAGLPAASADARAGNLPGGTSISVQVDSPSAGALVADSAAHPLTVSGSAGVGEGVANADTTLISVIDLSSSTVASGGCGGDANGDGSPNRIIDCEVAALRALNQAAIDAGSIDEVGVVAFGNVARVADVGPGSGLQSLTGPATDNNGNGIPDVEEVLSSASGSASRLSRFTPMPVGGSTVFEAAVRQTCALAQTASNPNVQVVFVSDGVSAGGAAVDDLPCAPTAATFNTIAAGAGSNCTTGGASRSLGAIAARTGAGCTHVTNLSQLPDVLPELIGSTLSAVEISVDGGAAVPVSTLAPTPPLDGPATLDWSHDLDLAPGAHTVCVTATGSDFGGPGSVTDCHDLTVATISLTPDTAVNDLSSDTSHTVTATVSAGPDGGVPGVTVGFEVGSGPSAPASGTDVTDASGAAAFTWTNPSQDASGLGTDSVVACFEDDLGHVLCADATKDWQDLSAPAASCVASVNPGGNGPAGGQPGGVTRSHGFFLVGAQDAIDPDTQVFVRDSGSGHVFGPFSESTDIKWTQARSGPTQKAIGGSGSAVAWHLTGTGDAEVYATDASGNTSDPLVCTVPSS